MIPGCSAAAQCPARQLIPLEYIYITLLGYLNSDSPCVRPLYADGPGLLQPGMSSFLTAIMLMSFTPSPRSPGICDPEQYSFGSQWTKFAVLA